jgi:hypothetical protein
MLRYVKYIPIFSVCVLTGCSHVYGQHGIIQNRGTDYLTASNIAPLKVPPGMSSSTIEAHYPVSEKEYPTDQRTVKLLPPDLSSANTESTKPVVATAAKSAPIKVNTETALANSVNQGYTAPIEEGKTISPAQKKQAETHYYDSYTRSSTGGVGTPIRSAISNAMPWTKNNGQNPATMGPKSVPDATRMSPAQNSAANKSTVTQTTATTNVTPSAPATASKSAEAQSSGKLGKSLSSIAKAIWPWGNSEKPSEATQQNKTATAANGASNSDPEAAKMPGSNMYYDRYSKR